MRWDLVYEGETLGDLSARLHVPGCMLLRANRIFSEAWLIPGREILVPEMEFCMKDRGPCPVMALRRKAERRDTE